MSFITSFFGGIGLKILGMVAIVGAVAAVLLGAKNAGRNAERVASMEKSLENREKVNEIEREIEMAHARGEPVPERLRRFYLD